MGLTTQQNLVLQQAQRLYDTVDRTGEHLDGKAAAVLQAGSLIVALVGATTLPGLVGSRPAPLVLLGLAAGFGAFIGMTVCAVLAWRPSDHKLVGATTWDEFFDDYISKEVDDAYNQVLSNLSDAITANLAANKRKARCVTWGTWLLVLQVAGILVIALGSALSGLLIRPLVQVRRSLLRRLHQRSRCCWPWRRLEAVRQRQVILAHHARNEEEIDKQPDCQAA